MMLNDMNSLFFALCGFLAHVKALHEVSPVSVLLLPCPCHLQTPSQLAFPCPLAFCVVTGRMRAGEQGFAGHCHEAPQKAPVSQHSPRSSCSPRGHRSAIAIQGGQPDCTAGQLYGQGHEGGWALR